jgi:hypothetical protein
MLREKRIVSKMIQLTKKIVDAVQRAADTLGTPFAEVVRTCVAADLQKRTARVRERKRAQEMGRDSA